MKDKIIHLHGDDDKLFDPGFLFSSANSHIEDINNTIKQLRNELVDLYGKLQDELNSSEDSNQADELHLHLASIKDCLAHINNALKGCFKKLNN